MALYFGSKKQKIIIDGDYCCLELFSTTDVINIVRLLSSDGYILKDVNGVYLIPKESE